MRALILGFVLAVMPLALTTPAWSGENGTGNYWAQGAISCGKYVGYAKEKGWSYTAMGAWAAGYITAYNRQTPNTYDIHGNTDMDSVSLWLENYCKAHPLSNLASAMQALIEELHPRRHKTKKQAGY